MCRAEARHPCLHFQCSAGRRQGVPRRQNPPCAESLLSSGLFPISLAQDAVKIGSLFWTMTQNGGAALKLDGSQSPIYLEIANAFIRVGRSEFLVESEVINCSLFTVSKTPNEIMRR